MRESLLEERIKQSGNDLFLVVVDTVTLFISRTIFKKVLSPVSDKPVCKHLFHVFLSQLF